MPRTSKLDLATRVVLGVMAVCGFVYAVAIVSSLAEQLLFDRISRGEFVSDAELLASHSTRDKAGKAVMGAALIFNLAWAFWTFRLLHRAWQAEEAPKRIRPLWEALSVFVPIINLWHPYLVTSAAADRLGARGASGLLWVWHVVAAGAVVVRPALSVILAPDAETIAELSFQTWIGAAVLVAQIAGIWVTGLVVTRLSDIQQSKDTATPAPAR